MMLRSLAIVGAVILVAAQEAPLRSGLDLELMDRSVRPQDDLYRFANGGWLQRTGIPADRVSYGAFIELGEKSDRDVHAIIQAIVDNRGRRPAVERKIADLYTSLIDEERIEALGVRPIGETLRKIDDIRTTRDLAALAGHLSAIGGGGPFAGSIVEDPGEPGTLVVQVTQGGILLPDRDHYLGAAPALAAIRQKYAHYLTRQFALLGRVRPEEQARQVLSLETEIARAHQVPADPGDPSSEARKFTLSQLRGEMPGFDWHAWARPQGIDRTPLVILSPPAFFRRFAALVSVAPLETWKAWLTARYVTAAAPFLSRGFSNARFDFFGRELTAQEVPIPRWKRGVALVNAYLGDAIGRRYVGTYFPPSAKAEAQKLLGHLIQAYREAIREADWLAPDTKSRALRKLAGMSTKLGHPDAWRDYTGLVVRADDLVGNIERARAFENRHRMSRLTAGRTGEWLITPQTANAYYSPGTNEIVVPAAILRPPFFDASADAAVNYGGIGAIIGHEIGHGLDDRGRWFDPTGRVRDWWTPQDEVEYRKRAAVLVDQFNGYRPLEDVRVDGLLTMRENIGDLGGLAIAHRAYRMSLGGRPAPVIDGFTGDQRLFIAWARIWRSKDRDDYLRQALRSQAYAPGEYRANGPVGHLTAFYEAFGVKPGDKLYVDPAKRVRIW